MIDHVSLSVSNFARSRAFYDAALKPLGIAVVMAFPPEEGGMGGGAGYGETDHPFFWIGQGQGRFGAAHVAFTAKSRAEVDAFYKAAMAAGGRDNGPPGIRPHYHATYYAAFVLDPDGYNIEAVCHAPA